MQPPCIRLQLLGWLWKSPEPSSVSEGSPYMYIYIYIICFFLNWLFLPFFHLQNSNAMFFKPPFLTLGLIPNCFKNSGRHWQLYLGDFLCRYEIRPLTLRPTFFKMFYFTGSSLLLMLCYYVREQANISKQFMKARDEKNQASLESEAGAKMGQCWAL